MWKEVNRDHPLLPPPRVVSCLGPSKLRSRSCAEKQLFGSYLHIVIVKSPDSRTNDPLLCNLPVLVTKALVTQ